MDGGTRNRNAMWGKLLVPLVIAILVLGATGCAPEPRWNVLVVTFDTTRADHLSCYGHPEAQTPVVDRLAADGALFEHATAPVPITLPSHSSLMTGKVPFAHGVRDNGFFALGEDQTTLAEILRDHGYRTAAGIGSYPLVADFGLDQGFELYEDHLSAEYEDLYGERIFPKERLFFDERRAARVNEAVLPWLESHHDEPFFLWVHYFDPHQPLEPPPPYDQRFAHDPYLGEIAYADESLGTLLGHLRRLGVEDRTIVVFTSDHGEGLGEHDESTHSLLVYQTTLHVPLIIRVPQGGGGRRITERVGLVDIAPTVLDLLGVPIPDGIQGRSLRPLLNAVPEDHEMPPRPIYAETLSPRLSHGLGELRALTVGHLKYIHGPVSELFDLDRDPDEVHNLLHDTPENAAVLRTRLEQYLAEHTVHGLDASVNVDATTAARLQALGYVHATEGRVGPIEEVLRDDGEPPQAHVAEVSQFSSAKDQLFRGHLVDAKVLIDDLIEANPGNPHYLELMATAEFKLGNHEASLEILDRLLTSSAGHLPPAQILTSIGRVFLAQGLPGEAVAPLVDAQELEPTAAGQYLLAKVYSALDRVSEERSHLERALELDPDYVPARLDLAILYAVEDDLVNAELHLLRALEANPYFERAHFNYGAFLVQTGRYQEALGHFERAVELKPDYLQPLHAMVECHLVLGDRERAQACLERLQGLAPKSRETMIAERLMEANG